VRSTITVGGCRSVLSLGFVCATRMKNIQFKEILRSNCADREQKPGKLACAWTPSCLSASITPRHIVFYNHLSVRIGLESCFDPEK